MADRKDVLVEALYHLFDKYVQPHLAIANDAQKRVIRMRFANHMNLIANHIEQGFFASGRMSTSFIRSLHRVISPSGEIKWRDAGERTRVAVMVPGLYKTMPNCPNSRQGERPHHYYAAPGDVNRLMEALVQDYNAKASDHPGREQAIEWVLDFVVRFIAIHPFGDCNGRVSRILLHALLLNFGLVLKVDFELGAPIATAERGDPGPLKKIMEEHTHVFDDPSLERSRSAAG